MHFPRLALLAALLVASPLFAAAPMRTVKPLETTKSSASARPAPEVLAPEDAAVPGPEVEAMIRQLGVAYFFAQGIRNETATADTAEEREVIEAVIADPGFIEGLTVDFATVLAPWLRREDVAAFSEFAARGAGDRLAAAIAADPSRPIGEHGASLRRRDRRAFEALVERGLLDRLANALQRPEAIGAFVGQLANVGCRIARSRDPARYDDVADQYCALATSLSDDSGLSDAPSSDAAIAVLRLFDLPAVTRHEFSRGIAAAADPSQRRVLEVMLALMDDEELLQLAGAELDRLAAPEDLQRLADYAQTAGGRRLGEALRGLNASNLAALVADLPPELLTEMESAVGEAALTRIGTALGSDSFEAVGVELGRRLVCRADPASLPPEVRLVLTSGMCRR
ncbi:hypothetical protein [Arenimonas composti]|uniref:DUF2059 domain-containing protein n=1 Tax=Arenimonas composti TR7-09 = DSM 18010 TaxID=1121013 RepID=A0A091BG14_9GAMM|nr:hypothetical protein [Arenimonas composti]KFN50691.1 hypothetical protein P873_05885 [Arenimonas composti TR7-09 = DSM 18010]